MIGITLIAGAAVLGWINGQAKTSEGAYGTSAANNVNFLKERFVAESQTFNACSGSSGTGRTCTGASFYLYNNGAVGFTLASIQIVSNNPTYPLNIVFYAACTSSATCTNPSGGSRESATAPAACTPAFEQVGQAVPPTGFYFVTGTGAYIVPATLPQGYLSTTVGTTVYGPYQITLPSCGTSPGQLYFYDTVAYTITFTGLYGNTVQETIAANG